MKLINPCAHGAVHIKQFLGVAYVYKEIFSKNEAWRGLFPYH